MSLSNRDWVRLSSGAVVQIKDRAPNEGDTVFVNLEEGCPRAVSRSSIIEKTTEPAKSLALNVSITRISRT